MWASTDGLRISFKGINAASFDQGYRCECKDGYEQIEVCLGDAYPNNPLCIPGCVPDCVEGMLFFVQTMIRLYRRPRGPRVEASLGTFRIIKDQLY